MTTLIGTRTAHPLDQVSAAEFDVNRAVLDAAGLIGAGTRFAYSGLLEPDKADVARFVTSSEGVPGSPDVPGNAVDPRIRSLLVDTATGVLTDAVVSVTDAALVTARTVDPVTEGQFSILDEEFARAEEIVHDHEGWRAAMARRALTDISRIRACPASRAAGSSACSRSTIPTTATSPGHTRSTGWPRTSTSSRIGCSCWSTTGSSPFRQSPGTTTTGKSAARRARPCGRSRSRSPRGRVSPSTER